MGALRLYLMDLDGAVAGEPRNLSIIKEIASAILVPVQMGCGIRSLDSIRELLQTGIERVVLGTAAIESPEMVKEACRRFGPAIAIGVDALNGCVAIRGWQETTDINAADFVKAMVRLGARRFIYTDISRDGTLTEPNFTAISDLINLVRFPIIAAGGISSIGHLRVLKKLGVEGAIVGKALYTGDINLKQALQQVNSDD